MFIRGERITLIKKGAAANKIAIFMEKKKNRSPFLRQREIVCGRSGGESNDVTAVAKSKPRGRVSFRMKAGRR